MSARIGLVYSALIGVRTDRPRPHYCVRRRLFRHMKNVGACFNQTAHRVDLLPLVSEAIAKSRELDSIGLDTYFWMYLLNEGRGSFEVHRFETTCGIKGLPGRRGIGVGHQERFAETATPDPDLETLREWIGLESAVYAGFYEEA